MMVVMNYLFEGIEYMVCSSEDVQGIGSEGLALLADRRHGVGADKIIIANGSAYGSFEVYGKDGGRISADAEAWKVMAVHARRTGLVLDSQKLARAIGENAIETQPMSVAEIHVTNYFCGVLKESAEAALAV